jgi:hypothetical protein
MPFSTKLLRLVGLESRLCQPPLPASDNAKEKYLCGTDDWKITLPYLYSPKSRLCWVSVGHGSADGEEQGQSVTGSNNADCGWPDTKPLAVGMWFDDAILLFEHHVTPSTE